MNMFPLLIKHAVLRELERRQLRRVLQIWTKWNSLTWCCPSSTVHYSVYSDINVIIADADFSLLVNISSQKTK